MLQVTLLYLFRVHMSQFPYYSGRMYGNIAGEIDPVSGRSCSVMSDTVCMHGYSCRGVHSSICQCLYVLNSFDEM